MINIIYMEQKHYSIDEGGQGGWRLLYCVDSSPKAPPRGDVNPALRTLLLSDSQTFFDAIVAKPMHALLDDARVSDVAEADGTVKLGTQYLKRARVCRAGQSKTRIIIV
jgi:hypothetical protein